MVDLADGARDLRGGTTLWEARNRHRIDADTPLSSHADVDVCIVGAGITGAFLAEECTRRGLDVLVLDRRGQQRGSTAASTSLLQWDLDAPLIALADDIGFERAARVYRRSRDAVERIAGLVHEFGIECGFERRSTLYLAGDKLDVADLREERVARERAGFTCDFLDRSGLHLFAGLEHEGGLLSTGAAEADPVALAHGLMSAARRRGARVAAPVTALDYHAGPDGVEIATDDGFEISARLLLLATGYEMPGFVQAAKHQIESTWALATEPLPITDPVFRQGALVWEASDPYLYMRTTPDRRIVAGGEDEASIDPEKRDALIGEKVAAILHKLKRLLPGRTLEAAYGWSGAFGATQDSMPLIGPIAGMPGCYAAFGYGGNGITFSAVAAEIIGRMISGEPDPLRDQFAVDRD